MPSHNACGLVGIETVCLIKALSVHTTGTASPNSTKTIISSDDSHRGTLNFRSNRLTSGLMLTAITSAAAKGANRDISGGSAYRFQPMSINFGIIESPKEKIKGGKKFIKQRTAEIALEYMAEWRNSQKHLEKYDGM